MSISIIDILEPLGKFPVAKAEHIQCGDLRLDAVLNASTLELSKKVNKEYVDEQIASIPHPDVTKSYVDSNFAKKTDIPNVPTKTSQLQNDSGFLTQHQSLAEYAKKADIPTVPTKVSSFENDKGYLTQHQSLANYALKSEIPKIPNKLSDFQNDVGYLTHHQDVSNKADVSDVLDLSMRVSSVEEENITLSARMDAFVSLDEGSTTGDAELLDIRVAADGITYTSAGESVRAQISGIKSEIERYTETGIVLNESLNVGTHNIEYSISKGHVYMFSNTNSGSAAMVIKTLDKDLNVIEVVASELRANKTVYFKSVSEDQIINVKESIENNINYTKNTIEAMFLTYLKKEYPSPSEYLSVQ